MGEHKLSSKRTVVVIMGIMGRTPVAGVAWQALHFLEGFRRLGYDVYYMEDTGEWPYDADRNTVTDDPGYTVRYIGKLMEWCGLGDRWSYRCEADGRHYGMSEGQTSRLLEAADVLLNVTGATVLRDRHLGVPIRIFLETDPVLPQIEVAQQRRFTIDLLSAHTHHFTYGENLGSPDCLVPVGGFDYKPTRQPVVLDWWGANGGGRPRLPAPACFTTIASWKQSGKDIEWNGETYTWSKHHGFMRIIDLPRRTEHPLELALACGEPDVLDLLRSHGWRVTDASPISKHIFPYRDYILGSRGEFTVAKDQYARTHSGWFSDRSACYLAAGRPVITQETGFSGFVPAGEGLFAFQDTEDILEALDSIESDYEGNCRAAREIAAEYFAAEKVLGDLMANVA